MSKRKENLFLGIPQSSLFKQSIADVFVLQGILDLEDAEKLKKHFRTNREIENFLIKNHLVTRDTINKAYSIILKLPFIELSNVDIKEEALAVIPEKMAKKYGIIPFDLSGKILKIAVTNPADLPLGFSLALSRLFKNKKVTIELFITTPEDYKETLKQYKAKRKKFLLIKKGSLPVVYLRNRQISRSNLNKIPKNFIEKYRLLVFDENFSGNYLIACEKPDSPITKKILDYIERENRVKLDVFATSKDDIDYVLSNYDNSSSFQVEPLHEERIDENNESISLFKNAEDDKREKKVNSRLPVLSSLSDLLFSSSVPSLTIDSITPKSHDSTVGNGNQSVKGEFHNDLKQRIIINEATNSRVPNNNSISLIGKVEREYLNKLPKEFIEKYRIVVFGENNSGELMLATDTSDSELTEKAIEFIKKQHPVEIFTTSRNDIEYAINIY